MLVKSTVLTGPSRARLPGLLNHSKFASMWGELFCGAAPPLPGASWSAGAVGGGGPGGPSAHGGLGPRSGPACLMVIFWSS